MNLRNVLRPLIEDQMSGDFANIPHDDPKSPFHAIATACREAVEYRRFDVEKVLQTVRSLAEAVVSPKNDDADRKVTWYNRDQKLPDFHIRALITALRLNLEGRYPPGKPVILTSDML